MPKPGESMPVFQTFTHKREYLDFQGRLRGYGAGDVTLFDRARALINYSTPDRILYSVLRRGGTDDYALVRTRGTTWVLHNMTREAPELGKAEKYKNVAWEEKLARSPGIVVGGKLDGGYTTVILPTGRRARAFSPRQSVKGERIEYTHKIPGLFDTHSVDSGDTMVAAEVVAVGEDGRALPVQRTSGLLNSDVLRSREEQEKSGDKLRLFLHNVLQYRGKDVRQLPYREKLGLMRALAERYPVFRMAPTAETEEEKRSLIREIKAGRHPLVSEGVVLWGSGPTKMKLRPDYDVYIRGFTEGEGRLKGKSVGGVEYSLTPDGPIVGMVGTGLTDGRRRDMWRHKKSYLGRVVKVRADGQFASGALRAPAFVDTHLDK
jgi:hypothetical protein